MLCERLSQWWTQWNKILMVQVSTGPLTSVHYASLWRLARIWQTKAYTLQAWERRECIYTLPTPSCLASIEQSVCLSLSHHSVQFMGLAVLLLFEVLSHLCWMVSGCVRLGAKFSVLVQWLCGQGFHRLSVLLKQRLQFVRQNKASN